MEKVIRKMEADIPSLPLRKRVAAYARVSSGKDAMLHSLSAQVSYYSEHIQSHPEWEYAGVYVDEALTGTSFKLCTSKPAGTESTFSTTTSSNHAEPRFS